MKHNTMVPLRYWIGVALLYLLIASIFAVGAQGADLQPCAAMAALELSGSAKPAVAPAAPYWQRQPGETCEEYEARVEANGYELWGLHWCGQGPCYREFTSPTGEVVRSAGGFSRGEYWVEQKHGCWGTAP